MNKAKVIRSEPATTSRPDFFFSYHFLQEILDARYVFSFNTELITPYLIDCTSNVLHLFCECDLPMTIAVLKRLLFNALNILPLVLERKRKYRQTEF